GGPAPFVWPEDPANAAGGVTCQLLLTLSLPVRLVSPHGPGKDGAPVRRGRSGTQPRVGGPKRRWGRREGPRGGRGVRAWRGRLAAAGAGVPRLSAGGVGVTAGAAIEFQKAGQKNSTASTKCMMREILSTPCRGTPAAHASGLAGC